MNKYTKPILYIILTTVFTWRGTSAEVGKMGVGITMCIAYIPVANLFSVGVSLLTMSGKTVLSESLSNGTNSVVCWFLDTPFKTDSPNLNFS